MEENPVGVRFFPTDEQIFSHYLKKKILDPTDVSVQSVNEVDLLKFEPWDLRWQSARQREDEDRYFFWSPELYGNSRSTKKRTKKNGEYCNKERYKRSTAAGYWKSTGEETEIKGYGVKRILVFHKRNRDSKTEVKTDYVMHEYDPSDIPDNKKRFVFLRLIKRNADDNLISSCRAGSKLLAPNSENNVTGIRVPEVLPLPPAQMKTFDGFNSINQNCVFAKQSPNAYEEESLNFIHTDASSPDEGQQSQDIRSSSPAEGQPNQHQLASDCGNRNLEGRSTEKFCQFYSELEKLLPPHLRVHKVEKSYVYTSFCDQGQPNQHLTFDFGDAFSEDNGLKVDPQPFSGSETHGGGNRSDHIYSALVPPPNRPEYESSNCKRFNNDVKSIFSEHEIQTDEEDYFKDLDSLVSLTGMSSCNSIRGVYARNSGDHHQCCMGEGIFSIHSREY